MLVDGREDGRERKVSPRGRNRGLVERDETARRSKGVVRWKGSVGRRFHFVSLPACGGAIAAALCQSVTLSRHPFYYLARGCPAPLSIRSAPSLLAAPPTSHGYNVDQARGCLTGCRSFASLSLSLFLFYSHSFSLSRSFNFSRRSLSGKWRATRTPPPAGIQRARDRDKARGKPR